MFRYFILEIVLPLLIFLFLRSFMKSIFKAGRSAPRREEPPQAPPVIAGGELKQDPVCGTFVSTALSIRRTANGETVYFCSEECRDKYRTA